MGRQHEASCRSLQCLVIIKKKIFWRHWPSGIPHLPTLKPESCHSGKNRREPVSGFGKVRTKHRSQFSAPIPPGMSRGRRLWLSYNYVGRFLASRVTVMRKKCGQGLSWPLFGGPWVHCWTTVPSCGRSWVQLSVPARKMTRGRDGLWAQDRRPHSLQAFPKGDAKYGLLGIIMHLPLEMINISSRASLLSNPSEPLHTVVISASCPVGVLFSRFQKSPNIWGPQHNAFIGLDVSSTWISLLNMLLLCVISTHSPRPPNNIPKPR